MTVSVFIVAWSALGVATRHGPSILLALFVALTLVGGGIGHVPFFLVVCAYATRIRSPLPWWRRRRCGPCRPVRGFLHWMTAWRPPPHLWMFGARESPEIE